MANRPVYFVSPNGYHVERISIDFVFCPGFSIQQKQKSIINIHDNFKKVFPDLKILEVSSKSYHSLGVRLSAFNLMINIGGETYCPVENVFQSSKVFENGGPYEDILFKTPSDAKRDSRLSDSGNIVDFCFRGRHYPTEPKTLFYNWLYIHSLYQKQNNDLRREIIKYDAFTDIEFNPKKSINCQAEACAHFVSLYRRGCLRQALQSIDVFRNELYSNYLDNQNGIIDIFQNN